VLEVETPPGGGCPPHVQRYEDETVYVLEGTYSFLFGEAEEQVSAGEARFAGRGTRHGYVNPGPGVARMVIHLSPGGIHERFIEEAGDASERPMWESDLARVIALAPAFGIEFEADGN
jgi:quercetin dioxygenase-like cupin family protein